MAKDDVVSVSKLQLWISVASIMLLIIGSVVAVTTYINSIDRRQSILEGKMDAFKEYGSATAMRAKSEVDIVAARQFSDTVLVNEKLKRIEELLMENKTVLSEVRADLKTHLKEK